MNRYQITDIRISIAMTTLNGAEYLNEQLESIARQLHRPFELVVCDDGSTDRTLDVLTSFARSAPFPVHIHRNQQNLGFALNFMKAARLCRGEWVAFCDQDDVWLPNKLSACAEAIRTAREPLRMIAQYALLTDEDLNPSGRLAPFVTRKGYAGPNEQFGFWVWFGFLTTVHRSLIDDYDFLKRPANYYPEIPLQSHDKWFAMLANALGGVVFLPEPVALYRRHRTALTGPYATQSLSSRMAKASRTGSAIYSFLASVAMESADCLERLATTEADPLNAERLARSASLFRRLSNIQSSRAGLYAARGISGRARAFFDILIRGGYLGHPFHRLGPLALGKDLLALFSPMRAEEIKPADYHAKPSAADASGNSASS